MADLLPRGRRVPLALAAIVLVGLLLRLLSARGGLWLDEAWSARLARDVGTPLGVFLSINHDNNHHLNSVWMQTVGFGAPPIVARGLSIVTGTLAIIVAGMIGARRGDGAALVTALLFAIAPVMVSLGSEARGYAPMSLALLTAILLTDRYLTGRVQERTPAYLAVCALLGAFSHLTILFGWVALVAWAFFDLWRRFGFKRSTGETIRLFWPSIVALGVVIGIVLGAGRVAGTGFQFGGYEPFTTLLFLHGVIEMAAFTLGSPWQSHWLLVAIAAAVIIARSGGVSRVAFYRLAILAFPLSLAALQLGNVGHPRYYLIAAIAFLILAGEWIGLAIAKRGALRWFGALLLGAIVIGSVVADIELIRNQRGDPARAVRAMQAAAPTGATILLDRDTGLAMMEYAAAAARYPLKIVANGCDAAPFLLADRFRGETLPGIIDRCGGRYVPFEVAQATGLSGTHWGLYRRTAK